MGLADELLLATPGGPGRHLLIVVDQLEELLTQTEGVRRGGQLSIARYDQLDGVQGALTHQADEALAAAVQAGGGRREQVIAGLLRLVTVDDQGRPTRYRVNRRALPDPVLARLEPFVTRRLLITDTDHGSVVIGVARGIPVLLGPAGPGDRGERLGAVGSPGG